MQGRTWQDITPGVDVDIVLNQCNGRLTGGIYSWR